MGKIVHLDKVRVFLKETPVFRTRDIELLAGSRGYACLTLHNLVRRGEIRRVTKGWYSSLEDPIVSVFCFKPAYLGLQEALSLHGLWEQETNVVIVTTRKVRTGVKNLLDSNVILHRIKQKYFFGFSLLKYENFFIPVSDVEKTLIDLVYFNEIPGRDVLEEIRRQIDKEKFAEYLKVFPQTFKRRVQDLMTLEQGDIPKQQGTSMQSRRLRVPSRSSLQ